MNEPNDKNPHKDSANQLEKHRREKLNSIREKGIDPYPIFFEKKDSIVAILQDLFPVNSDPVDREVQTSGRVMSVRAMGKASFFVIQDVDAKIQVYSNDKSLEPDEHFVLKNLDIGDIVGLKGKPFITKTGEKSLRAHQLVLLAKNLKPIPIVKEKDGETFDAFADVETRYRKRYLDLVVNSHVRKSFQKRFEIISEIRQFFAERGFLEVETPMMQAIASGAAARPFETWHNTLERKLYLRIAPELYLKRLIVGGFEKVFELNRNFRNEGISTKHNPEFTMLEAYVAYADFRTMMQLTEDLFNRIVERNAADKKIQYGDVTIDFSKGWKKLGYLESIQEYAGIDFREFLTEENPSTEKAKELAKSKNIRADKANTFWEVVDEVFSQKVEPMLIQPTFIIDFPLAISPLAKRKPNDPNLVERFEPYILGREMGNSFSELNDPDEQRKRFLSQVEMKEAGAQETIPLDEDFIEALMVGMPPTGGLGIGIDRLVMLFTNAPSIKDVILFPMLRGEKES